MACVIASYTLSVIAVLFLWGLVLAPLWQEGECAEASYPPAIVPASAA
jgi:hypothetical protein